MAVSGSPGAGSLFGHSRQYDEKKVKIEDEGACSHLYAEQAVAVSHEPEQCPKVVCAAWGWTGDMHRYRGWFTWPNSASAQI